MTPAILLGKTDRALAWADTLLYEGDTEGACNRAYYAMFHAARAALILIGAPPKNAGEFVQRVKRDLR